MKSKTIRFFKSIFEIDDQKIFNEASLDMPVPPAKNQHIIQQEEFDPNEDFKEQEQIIQHQGAGHQQIEGVDQFVIRDIENMKRDDEVQSIFQKSQSIQLSNERQYDLVQVKKQPRKVHKFTDYIHTQVSRYVLFDEGHILFLEKHKKYYRVCSITHLNHLQKMITYADKKNKTMIKLALNVQNTSKIKDFKVKNNEAKNKLIFGLRNELQKIGKEMILLKN